jgi:hypothetical protein
MDMPFFEKYGVPVGVKCPMCNQITLIPHPVKHAPNCAKKQAEDELK